MSDPAFVTNQFDTSVLDSQARLSETQASVSTLPWKSARRPLSYSHGLTYLRRGQRRGEQYKAILGFRWEEKVQIK